MNTRTPGPWRIVQTADDRTFIDTEESNENFIAQIDRNAPEYEKNAAFIVRACNNHEAMLEALQAVNDWSDLPAKSRRSDFVEMMNKVMKAIAKAEGSN